MGLWGQWHGFTPLPCKKTKRCGAPEGRARIVLGFYDGLLGKRKDSSLRKFMSLPRLALSLSKGSGSFMEETRHPLSRV